MPVHIPGHCPPVGLVVPAPGTSVAPLEFKPGEVIASSAGNAKPTPVTASLWIPGPLPGLNELLADAKGSGGRGYGYARTKRQWTDVIVALANQAKLPALRGPVAFTFAWVEKDRRRDPHNVSAGGAKIIFDSLVRAGVIAGDGWKHIASCADTFAVARPGLRGPGVLVSMQEVTQP